jgi:Fe2+ or Zn2+ uptake regulation protein
MSYSNLVRTHARIAILRFLEGAPRYTTNASMLTTALPRLGIPFTRDQVETELAWLQEQGLVETEENAGFVVATATVRGVEIAQGLATHPQIQRPRPGA